MFNFALGGVVCLLLVAHTAAVSAADEPVFSGPQPGEKLTPLKVVLAYGVKKGDQVDLVAAADGKPSLFVFVRGANRPAARLTRVLMNYAEMRTGDGLSAALVWLDDDRSGAQRYLQRAISWWGVGPPVGRAGTKELVEIAKGVTPLDKLIASGREGLSEGQRIKITGEESSWAASLAPPLPRCRDLGSPGCILGTVSRQLVLCACEDKELLVAVGGL